MQVRVEHVRVKHAKQRTQRLAKAEHVGRPLCLNCLNVLGAHCIAADCIQEQFKVDPVRGHAELADIIGVHAAARCIHGLKQQPVGILVLGPCKLPAQQAALTPVRSERCYWQTLAWSNLLDKDWVRIGRRAITI
jgi:hypothetical protein